MVLKAEYRGWEHLLLSVMLNENEVFNEDDTNPCWVTMTFLWVSTTVAFQPVWPTYQLS